MAWMDVEKCKKTGRFCGGIKEGCDVSGGLIHVQYSTNNIWLIFYVQDHVKKGGYKDLESCVPRPARPEPVNNGEKRKKIKRTTRCMCEIGGGIARLEACGWTGMWIRDQGQVHSDWGGAVVSRRGAVRNDHTMAEKRRSACHHWLLRTPC